jgi:hypothetical protein
MSFHTTLLLLAVVLLCASRFSEENRVSPDETTSYVFVLEALAALPRLGARIGLPL